MKYERLTKKEGWHKDIDLTQELGYSYIYQRLAELENKIEDDKLIELPCKVGDTVYCLTAQGQLGTIVTTGKPIARKIDKIILDGTRVEIYSERLSEQPTDCCYYGYLGETVFLTKTEAELKLKELQGE